MAFYNVQQGDAPYFKHLADHYSMSDNFHQSVDGGTGANHIMLGHGDAIWFSDGNGNALVPPHNTLVDPGTANAGTVDEVENPNPASGTNNWYTPEDGLRRWVLFGSASTLLAEVRIAIARIRLSRESPSSRIILRRFLCRYRSSLRSGALLPAEQLQSRLLRQRQ